MKTYINNKEVKLNEYPQSPEAWENNPQITYTCCSANAPQVNDRILAGTQMAVSGSNSGAIVNVYYVIQEITNTIMNTFDVTKQDVTAIVKRVEL